MNSNPGGIAWALDLTPSEMQENYAEGLRCGNGIDELNGKPTGIIRVSLGAMSNRKDVEILIQFLQMFVDKQQPFMEDSLCKTISEKEQVGDLLHGKATCANPHVLMTELETPMQPSHAEDLTELRCPVARCKEIFYSEKGLLSHFGAHRVCKVRKKYRGLARLTTYLC